MQTRHQDDEKERTLVAVLNEGLIPFKRIIPDNDNAFVLEHRVLETRKQIVLFFTPTGEAPYKMFIHCKEQGCLEEILYDNMENTWSIYNSLCKTLYNEYFINKVKNKKINGCKNPPI